MKNRLQNLVNQLKDRGVVDIKFHYDRKLMELSKLVEEVCEIFECVLEGRYTKAKPLGDSVRIL